MGFVKGLYTFSNHVPKEAVFNIRSRPTTLSTIVCRVEVSSSPEVLAIDFFMDMGVDDEDDEDEQDDIDDVKYAEQWIAIEVLNEYNEPTVGWIMSRSASGKVFLEILCYQLSAELPTGAKLNIREDPEPSAKVLKVVDENVVFVAKKRWNDWLFVDIHLKSYGEEMSLGEGWVKTKTSGENAFALLTRLRNNTFDCSSPSVKKSRRRSRRISNASAKKSLTPKHTLLTPFKSKLQISAAEQSSGQGSLSTPQKDNTRWEGMVDTALQRKDVDELIRLMSMKATESPSVRALLNILRVVKFDRQRCDKILDYDAKEYLFLLRDGIEFASQYEIVVRSSYFSWAKQLLLLESTLRFDTHAKRYSKSATPRFVKIVHGIYNSIATKSNGITPQALFHFYRECHDRYANNKSQNPDSSILMLTSLEGCKKTVEQYSSASENTLSENGLILFFIEFISSRTRGAVALFESIHLYKQITYSN